MPRQQLSDEVASHIRQAIMSGEYEPGTSVRAEAIAEKLDVSATPVREALHTLRAEGFLNLVPRKGFTVAALIGEDILDIFEAHALIAGELTARAAERTTPQDVERLEELHQELVAAAQAGEVSRLEELNDEFHRSIYRLSGSKRLRWALSGFNKYVPKIFYTKVEGWPEVTISDHERVLDAIRRSDSEAARNAIATHIREGGKQIAKFFER